MQDGPYWIGVDLHSRVIQVCVLGSKGQVVFEERCPGSSLRTGLRLVRELARRFRDARVVVEALGSNRWFVKGCQRLNLKVTVAHAAGLGLKHSGKKTDRRDAYELARRLRLGDLDKNARAYFPTDQEYGQRQLLRRRHTFVQTRTKLIAQIRAALRTYRIQQPAGDLYSARNLERLKRIVLRNSLERLALEALVDSLEFVHRQVRKLDDGIAKESKENPSCAALKLIPYVGPLTSVTLIAELGDVNRFRNSKCVASYAGLVPRVVESAGHSLYGRIVNHGSRELRYVLGEWAVQLLARHPVVQRWAEARLRRMPKNKVRITLARKLLVGVWHTLRTGEIFELERCLATA